MKIAPYVRSLSPSFGWLLIAAVIFWMTVDHCPLPVASMSAYGDAERSSAPLPPGIGAVDDVVVEICVPAVVVAVSVTGTGAGFRAANQMPIAIAITTTAAIAAIIAVFDFFGAAAGDIG